MYEKAVREMMEEVDRLAQAVRDAEGALDAAEKELDQLLAGMPAEGSEE